MNEKIKVLVVDDSSFARATIAKRLNSNSEINVVGFAKDGTEAVDKVKSLRPDVVTMDVVMPGMDGLTALGHIMSECPTPVVMLSALTSDGAETTIKALELGAVDFYLKHSAFNPSGNGNTTNSFIDKIKLAAKVNMPGSKTTALKSEIQLQNNGKTRVLVVDDSGFARASIIRKLESDPEIEVINFARDGAEAIDKVKSLKPDVVTLDIVMPGMDGLTALEHIMSECPTPVVMLSALTSDGAETTIKALEMGAVDFFLKASTLSPAGNESVSNALIDKIKLAAKTSIPKSKTASGIKQFQNQKGIALKTSRVSMDRVLVIGTSTGGPKALMQVIPYLSNDLSAAILVVQHMPPGFTKSLAERLDQASQVEVKEAQAEDRLEAGKVLLAPGDYHMTVTKDDKIALNQDPPVWGVRPSVDVTMESVATIYRSSSLGAILTGMGSDGTRGASLIKASGGKIAAEHESTCAVYGMPMSVIDAGYADKVVPIHKMALEITRMCKGNNKS